MGLGFSSFNPVKAVKRAGSKLLKGAAGLVSPKTPKLPKEEAAQLPPERADPAVLAAAEKLRLAELRRRGRASTFLAGGKRTLNTAPLGRPAAGSDQLGA